MTDNPQSFSLCDGDILLHLLRRKRDPCRPLSGGDHQFFEGLQHTRLIQALLDRKYSTADRLLRKLTDPLSPQDAIAACLCALNSTEERMGRILDHCPPLPDFQFLGVGKTASLLNVAARLNLYKMLELFLKRGADPNANPAVPSVPSPLEVAFCADAVLSLERLLRSPNLHVELTPAMLKHWGELDPDLDAPYPLDLMCCQLLVETLTGTPSDPKDPFPFPPQLTLEIILAQKNLPFAAHLCRKRPLAKHEQETALQFLSAERRIVLLSGQVLELDDEEDHRHYADFLLSVLDRYPEWIHLPQLRFPILTAALVPHKPEAALQALVEQLEDGPVFFNSLSGTGNVYIGRLHLGIGPLPRRRFPFVLSAHLFPRWEERLGSRFVPAMEVSAELSLRNMDDEEMQLVLDRITFVGQRPADELSAVGWEFLLRAPEAMLPQLLRPGGLLTQEAFRPLLDAVLELPPARRNLLLPFLHKEADYEL